MMPRKRKIAGKNKQAVDDLFTFDLELPKFEARENSDLLERSAKEVSTKLVVYDDTWSTKDNEPYVRRTNMKEKVLTYNIGLMKNYMPGEEEEEERIGLSTKLKLFSYPWKITKTLTISDVGHMSRLLVNINSVERYVLPFLDVELISEVHSKKGLTVNVWDHDTNSTHGLFFKKWVSMNCFVFNGKWNQNFVHRRNLRAGDKIGLYWDSFYSRLSFCVLDRAAPTIQEAPALE
ncbi:B3 domain-containing protein [Melia azedarach]|uniref:B3 domain-containing protein n=1 Tax=Melia azedarach TaxID=155640 RepID=A0ACC1X3D4_MELAZ|nr:B3 domain-containing protein [Melia azedarach]